jgi:hypothetical protein
MSVWLPVLFICLSTNNNCEFYSGNISVSVEQCAAQNDKAEALIKRSGKAQAYQMACIEIKPKANDSL